LALRIVLLFWIGVAALAVGWQLGMSDIPTSPPGSRYLVFIVALVATGGVSTLRSKGPGGILMATVSALALTVIAVIGADTVA
jgi:hypothetical protein